MQDFSVDGVPPNVWGSDFSRVERNFTIGQIPKIWGDFSKFALKLIKICKIIGNILEKCKFFGNFLIFWRAIIF